ncbi:MAG: hypothetical protein C5B52_18970 [Bacteroidetes bacterium]|nr:MAG: hypothetical protein C5B52_18970 [Bacteroidota bacterium]
MTRNQLMQGKWNSKFKVMRQEIKNYYAENFGSFTHLSAIEITELSRFEFEHLGLPEVLYIKHGWIINNGDGTVSSEELHARILRSLSINKN